VCSSDLEAATAYIAAMRASPYEPRALRHLQGLVKKHRDVVALAVPLVDVVIKRFRRGIFDLSDLGPLEVGPPSVEPSEVLRTRPAPAAEHESVHRRGKRKGGGKS
jgi:hypothetical protein